MRVAQHHARAHRPLVGFQPPTKGKANLSITTIGLIPVPDLARIPHDQLQRLAASFDDHADKDLLPANEAWHDPVRQSLDESVLCAALDLPSIILGP